MGPLPMVPALLLTAAFACGAPDNDSSAPPSARVTEIWAAGGSAEIGGLVLREPYAGAIGPNDVAAIVDRRGGKAVLLSSSGEVVTEVGSPGGGPGEFRNPVNIGFSDDSLLWVVDGGHNRITWFGPDGRPVREFMRPGEPIEASEWTALPYSPLAREAVLARATSFRIEAESIPSTLWRPDGALAVPRWIPLRGSWSLQIPTRTTGTSPLVGPQLIESRPIIGASPDGEWWFVLERTPPPGARSFTIERFDPAGTPIDPLHIAYEPQPVDEEVLAWLEGWARAYEQQVPAPLGVRTEDVLAALWIPETLPPVREALADRDGLWLRREQTRPGLWERYGLDGTLVARAVLPPDLKGLAANATTIIGWESDSLQVPVVRAFTIEQGTLPPGHTTGEPDVLALEELGGWTWESAAIVAHAALLPDSSVAVLTRDGQLHLLSRDSSPIANLSGIFRFTLLTSPARSGAAASDCDCCRDGRPLPHHWIVRASAPHR